MRQIGLNDESHFERIPGLWKGERAPLRTAKVFRATNFGGDGLLDYNDVVELQVEERLFPERRLAPGDIIVERSGGGPKQPVGRVALFNPQDMLAYFSSNFTTTLRIRDRNVLDPEYVALYLHAQYLDGATANLQRATTGIRNLDWQEYLKLKVATPSIDTQRAIAHLIGGVRRAYRVEDQHIATLISLKRAAMASLFTCGLRGEVRKETEVGSVPSSWDLVKLGTLGRIGNGTTPNRRQSGYWQGGTIPWITSGRMYEGRISSSDTSVTQAALDDYSLPLLYPGAVLIAIVGQGKTLGHCALLDVRATVSRHVGFIQPHVEIVSPEYLRGYLEYRYDYLRQLASGNGSTRAALTGALLRTISIPLPSLTEQSEIVDLLEAIDRTIALHSEKRAILEELFKALLHKLMTGEISVNDFDLSALNGLHREAGA